MTAISGYGWMAFAFSVIGILVYFAALMCTHLAAFKTASNIRKQGMAHLMKTPLGFFDNNASGLIRNRLDGASAETETLLAHNLADIVGTVAMFVTMIVLMFVFDWRMGAACLLAAVISVAAMFSMMGGKNAGLMAEYQAAQLDQEASNLQGKVNEADGKVKAAETEYNASKKREEELGAKKTCLENGGKLKKCSKLVTSAV